MTAEQARAIPAVWKRRAWYEMSFLSRGMAPMSDSTERRRLESWKAIGAHLGRTVRTVQRWERDEGLPVHRLEHHKLSSIYAYVDELDAWWVSRSDASRIEGGTGPGAPPAAPPPASPTPLEADLSSPWQRRGLWVAGVSTLLLLAVLAMAIGLAPSPARQTRADVLYASARQAWNRRTPDGFSDARALFEAAIQTSPRHARAHAGLADTYSLLWAFGLSEKQEALPRAREAAQRALSIDPDLAEGHASLSYVLWEEGDRDGAEVEAKRAIALDPNYPTARHWYALYLQAMKRFEAAITQGEKAVALDPDSPILASDLSIMLRSVGRNDEAEQLLEQARRRHPTFPDVYTQLAMIQHERGRDRDAVPLLKQGIALGDHRPRMLAILGCMEARTGNLAGAQGALNQLEARARQEFIPRDAQIVLLAHTGDLDGAYRELDRAHANGDDWLPEVLSAPCFEPLRRDARWPALEQRLMARGSAKAP